MREKDQQDAHFYLTINISELTLYIIHVIIQLMHNI